jgi:hypothetical protein
MAWTALSAAIICAYLVFAIQALASHSPGPATLGTVILVVAVEALGLLGLLRRESLTVMQVVAFAALALLVNFTLLVLQVGTY